MPTMEFEEFKREIERTVKRLIKKTDLSTKEKIYWEEKVIEFALKLRRVDKKKKKRFKFKTILTYIKYTIRFINFVKNNYNASKLEDLTEDQAIDFVDGYFTATAATVASAIKSFFYHMKGEKIDIPYYVESEKMITYYTSDEVKLMIDYFSASKDYIYVGDIRIEPKKDLEMACLISLLWDTALRSGEVLALRWVDVDIKGKKLTTRIVEDVKKGVFSGKTGVLTKAFTDRSAILLEELKRERVIVKPESYIFTRTWHAYYYKLSVALRKLGIPKKPSLHAFRHGRLTELAATESLQYLKEYSGHKSFDTLSIYLHLSASSLGRIDTLLENATVEDNGDEEVKWKRLTEDILLHTGKDGLIMFFKFEGDGTIAKVFRKRVKEVLDWMDSRPETRYEDIVEKLKRDEISCIPDEETVAKCIMALASRRKHFELHPERRAVVNLSKV